MQPHLLGGRAVMVLVLETPGVWRALDKERLTFSENAESKAGHGSAR